MIRFRCPQCGQKFRVGDEAAGRKGKCPKCGTVFTAPSREETRTGSGQALDSSAFAGRDEGAAGPSWRAGQELEGGFRVVKLLGAGGMGEVYLVERPDWGDRFAAKLLRAEHLEDETRRRGFLRELQNWLDLPPHPHVVRCNFFRTIDGRIAIFSEYVDGGDLKAWLMRREGRERDLAEALDLAVQFCEGMGHAHRCGLVHRDVKPANCLLTSGGELKIADLGLAKALDATGEGDTSHSLMGRWGTQSYVSPEHASGGAVDRRTDIWAFGILLQQLALGWEPPERGQTARHRFLDESRRAGASAVPAPLAKVVLHCLEHEPEDRGARFEAVSAALREAYRLLVGRDYPREFEAPETGPRSDAEHDRRTTTGVTWHDPLTWLRKGLREAGRDPAEAERLAPRRTGSRRAQAVADLAVYEEAARLYQGLVDGDRSDLAPDLAALLQNKAFVHGNLDDAPGQIAAFDKVIAIRDRLVHQEGRTELANGLARTYLNKGNALKNLGEARTALPEYDKAIAIRERLVLQEGRTELAGDLAWTQLSWADIARNHGKRLEATREAREALRVLDAEVRWTGRSDLQGALKWARKNLADLL